MKLTLPTIIAMGLLVSACQSTPKQQTQQVVQQQVKNLGVSQQIIDDKIICLSVLNYKLFCTAYNF